MSDPGWLKIEIDGNPLPKQSTRFAGDVHAYTDPRIKAYQDYVSWVAKEAMIGRSMLKDDVRIWVTFYRSDRRTVDLDNLEKCLFDGFNKIVWKDDKQIIEKHTFKKYDKKHPRTCVMIRL